MPGNTIETAEQSIAITDPGDQGREKHGPADRLMINIGNIAAWLFPILMIAIVTQVIIRKFGYNQAWLDDAQWWMYGTAMLVGFGYAITTESHVRVDILHQYFAPAKKAKIEIFALGWLLCPFLILMTDIMTHYGLASWRAGEGSDSANGLHGLYLLKMLLPILFAVALIAAGAVLVRHLKTLTRPTLWAFIIGAFPAAWFFMERVSHYVVFWGVSIAKPELNPRRITREPVFDYVSWVGLAIVVLLFLISYVRSRSSRAEA